MNTTTNTNDVKLNSFTWNMLKAFGDLSAPINAAAAIGEYESSYIGPAVMRVPAPLVMKAVGFSDWHGKAFRARAGDAEVLDGMNMFGSAATRSERFPMTAQIGASLIDAKPALIVTYPSSTRQPWRRATDELRVIDDVTLLGFTTFAYPMGKFMPVPFLLRREAV